MQEQGCYLCTMSEDELTLKIEGMTCSHCERAVVELAMEVDGVVSAVADAESSSLRVTYEENREIIESILENINSTNSYKASQP